MKSISSRDNLFFKELKKLTSSARERKLRGQTLLDGIHLLQACLDAGRQPLHVLVNAAALQRGEITALLEHLHGVPLTWLDDGLFGELTELKSPSGILALIDVPQPVATVAESRFALLLEDIQDPGNLGSMIRTAAAAGCDAVFLSLGCTDAWSPKVLRGGMGGHFLTAIHESVDLAGVARAFHGRVYAASLRGSQSLYECDLGGNVAFAIGNEGAGLSDELLSITTPFTIPMPGNVESLNAAAAAAVCLFESVRVRTSS